MFALFFTLSSHIPGTQKCVRGCELGFHSPTQDSTTAPNLFSARWFCIYISLLIWLKR